MNNPIKIAVVGAGHIGQRHAAIISQHPACSLAAICDIKAEKKLLAQQYQVPFYSDLGEMLKTDFEVLAIATPNSFHAPQAMLALEVGRHLILEKPVCLSPQEAAHIQSAAEKNGKKIFCVMQNRYSPTSVWLKEVIRQGLLGEIYKVQVNCYWNRDERYYTPESWHGKAPLDGGPIFTQFSHFIDILYWLFGEITNLQARFHNFNHRHNTDYEDSGDICFEFVKGGTGSFHYSTAVFDQNLESSLTIIAEKGSIKVGGQYMNEVVYCHIQDYLMPVLPPAGPPNDYGAYKGSAANHHFIYENVVNALRAGAEVDIPITDGKAVVEMIAAMYGI